MTTSQSFSTIAEIMTHKQDDLLELWLKHIMAQPKNRILELMTETELRQEAASLLQTLCTAFSSGHYDDLDRPEFAATVDLLRRLSTSRAEQGFTSTETAAFIFSLKHVLLEFVQTEFADDFPRLNAEFIKLNNALDLLVLVTFETYVHAREEVVTQQSYALLELSTPVIRVWNHR